MKKIKSGGWVQELAKAGIASRAANGVRNQLSPQICRSLASVSMLTRQVGQRCFTPVFVEISMKLFQRRTCKAPGLTMLVGVPLM